MNSKLTSRLRRLHAATLQGEIARAERDRMLLMLHEVYGVSQTDLAELLTEFAPGTMTRNQMQKVITRQRDAVERGAI